MMRSTRTLSMLLLVAAGLVWLQGVMLADRPAEPAPAPPAAGESYPTRGLRDVTDPAGPRLPAPGPAPAEHPGPRFPRVPGHFPVAPPPPDDLGNAVAQAGSKPEPPPGPDGLEVEWSAWLARQVGGTPEFRLPNGGRVDVLETRTVSGVGPGGLVTERIAWEVEWAQKWPESVGQAVFYSLALDGRDASPVRPGIWLLKRPGPSDDERYLQCLAVVRELRGRGLDLRFRVEAVGTKPAP